MKYQATIKFSGESKDVVKLFESEEKVFKHKRSKYTLEQKKKQMIFHVQAEDATALRATLDSIVKGLKIYEDMKEIK